MTTIALSGADPTTLRAGALVVGVTAGPHGPVPEAAATDVDRALRGGGRGRGRRPGLISALTALGATGAAGECHLVPTFGAIAAATVAVVGLGESPGRGGPIDPEVVRRAVGGAVRALAGTSHVAVALPASSDADVAAIAEGALLGSYSFERYRNPERPDRRPPAGKVTVVVPAADRSHRAALSRAEAVCDAVAMVRDLVNTPPSDLYPQAFAEIAAKAARAAGCEVEILDDKALRRGGYGGIIGVGQGSTRPPRLLRIRYRHPRAQRSVALVGKGITFDSGGLSLKPAAGMDWMKSDMGGAAAVVASAIALARLRVRIDVTAWAPLAENMPSGAAQRPSDVLSIYGGKTVEVLNTDAEGRLVLADALVRASEENPDVIVDVATLTGAQLVALGTRTSAVMADDDDVRAAVCDAAARAGEAVWPMPLPEELRKSLDSPVADIANIGDRNGGMLVAGIFLREFVGQRDADTGASGGRGSRIPWAHLDIAGPAYNLADAYGYTPKGGTGVPVRTLVTFVEDVAAGRALPAR